MYRAGTEHTKMCSVSTVLLNLILCALKKKKNREISKASLRISHQLKYLKWFKVFLLLPCLALSRSLKMLDFDIKLLEGNGEREIETEMIYRHGNFLFLLLKISAVLEMIH